MERNNYLKSGLNIVDQIDAKLAPYFEKAPALPENIRELLAKITPYFTIISVVLSIIGLIAALGLTGIAGPFMTVYGGFYGAQAVGQSIFTIIFLAIQIVIEALAIQGLLRMERNGWKLLYLASLIGALYNLVTLNLMALLIGFLISFYLLYQVKPYFRN